MNVYMYIRDIREQRGLTQRQLMKMAGISYGALVNAEQGKLGTKLDTLYKIARALHMEVWEIMIPPILHKKLEMFLPTND